MSLRSGIKNVLFGATGALGVQAFLRRLHRRRLLVLCYHGVVAGDHAGDRHEYRNTVAAFDFERQMRHLARHFSPVSAARVLDWIDGGRELPDRAVLVTFDDGYRNNLTQALPVLQRCGVPAIVFVTTGHIGSCELLWPTEVELRVERGGASAIPMPDGTSVPLPADREARIRVSDDARRRCKSLADAERQSYLDQLRVATTLDREVVDAELVDFLDWDQVRQLHAEGVAIGAHTVSHPILTKIEPEQLASELTASKRIIEAELGVECPWLAYPNGGAEDFSPGVLDAVEKAGYRVAFSLMDGLNAAVPPNRFAIDRISVPGHVGPVVFGTRTSGLHSRLRGQVGA